MYIIYRMCESEKTWHCYLLQSDDKQRTYIGATVSPDRRVRQHNSEISGGARATKGRHWRRIILVSGFPNEVAALQFEWAWKFQSRKCGSGLKARFQGLSNLLKLPRSTSKAIPFSEWTSGLPTIHLEVMDSNIHLLFNQMHFESNTASVISSHELSNGDLHDEIPCDPCEPS